MLPINRLSPSLIPNLPSYGPAELNLSKRWTRASYKAAFGVQAPPWSRAHPIQRWWDSDAKGSEVDVIVYHSWVVKDGKPSYEPFSILASFARSPNLPGLYDFPKWDPPPLKARMTWITGFLPAPSPDAFCTEEEAKQIQSQLGGSLTMGGVEPGNIGAVVYEWNEPRRPWILTLPKGDAPQSAGLLLRSQSLYGVGAPGKWDITNPNNPVWVTAAQETGEQDLRPEIPIPQRELYPGEEWMPNPFAGDLGMIVRKSLLPPSPIPAGGISEEILQKMLNGNADRILNGMDVQLKALTPALVNAVFSRITGIPQG